MERLRPQIGSPARLTAGNGGQGRCVFFSCSYKLLIEYLFKTKPIQMTYLVSFRISQKKGGYTEIQNNHSVLPPEGMGDLKIFGLERQVVRAPTEGFRGGLHGGRLKNQGGEKIFCSKSSERIFACGTQLLQILEMHSFSDKIILITFTNKYHLNTLLKHMHNMSLPRDSVNLSLCFWWGE